MKKIYQIADNHKKLEAQKTNDVLDSQIELIEDLENDILQSIAPGNLYLFKQWEKDSKSNIDIPLNLFPKLFRDYGKELKFILNSENNYIIGGFLAALSGAIGNGIKLYANNYQNVPCFYIACIGNSGANKSETLRRLMKPLDTIDQRLSTEFDIQEKNYRLNKEISDHKTDAVPIKEMIVFTEATMEALCEAMVKNQKGLIYTAAELKGFFDNLNKYRAGSDIPYYLQIWSQEGFNILRKSIPGGGYRIDKPFVSIIGMIQREKFKEVVNTKIGISDGFLWRFLPCLGTIDQRVRPLDQNIDKDIEDRYNNFIIDIYDYLYRNTLKRNLQTDKLEVHSIPFYLEVQADLLYKDYIAFCIDRWNKTPNEQIRQMINKIEIYCLRFAIVLHVAEHGSRIDKITEIKFDTMSKSIQLSEYFLEAMQQNFDQLIGEGEKILGVSNKYADFYKALPEDKIKRTFAVELGKNFKISARRVDEFLKRKDMFKKIEHGSYIKV